MMNCDKFDTIENFYKYIEILYESAEVAEEYKCQLKSLLSNFYLMPAKEKKTCFSMMSQQFWTIYGSSNFPFSSKIAIRIFNAPASSASSERV